MKDPKARRTEFEAEYRGWIRTIADDVAKRLQQRDSVSREAMLRRYRALEDPRFVFSKISDIERITRLARGETGYIFLETEAVTIFPSIFAPLAHDFAVAMNRRFYVEGRWFNVITLNSEYIRRSSDKMLAFALQHEFEMSRLFGEVSLRKLSPGEKQSITGSAMEAAVGKLSITPDELREDERLMIDLSETVPLIPKPYAEMALLVYLEKNYDALELLGDPGRDEEEEAFGVELYQEFSSWREFSHETYLLFVREMRQRLKDVEAGYV